MTLFPSSSSPSDGHIFTLVHQSGNARAGELSLSWGKVRTPTFMPVGTQGCVKGLGPAQLHETGAQIMLANAYHLCQRPGESIIAKLGGLQKFCGWRKPMLTDSGGYQVFSLAKNRHIDEHGVCFRDPKNGALIELTPARATAIQQQLGADIIMCFDECTPYPVDHTTAAISMRRSMHWAQQCRHAHQDNTQFLFGIIQGSTYLDLRQESLEQLVNIGFAGFAIGGLAIGEPHNDTLEVLASVLPQMPPDKPRYVMGMGTPLNLVEAVALGADMFDCVMPTRNARNGSLFCSHGVVRIRNTRYAKDNNTLDVQCDCSCCTHFSRAYLHHLEKNNELLYYQLASMHNLRFYARLLEQMRTAMQNNTFNNFYRQFTRHSPYAAS